MLPVISRVCCTVVEGKNENVSVQRSRHISFHIISFTIILCCISVLVIILNKCYAINVRETTRHCVHDISYVTLLL